MKEEHLAARAREADEASEQDRSGITLPVPTHARERIETGRDHRECPDDVDQRLGKTVIGRATRERTPHTPEAGGEQCKDQAGAARQRRLSGAAKAAQRGWRAQVRSSSS